MPRRRVSSAKQGNNGATVTFEAELGQMPDALRNSFAVLRDALLPKLISGELRVREAERFVIGRQASLDEGE